MAIHTSDGSNETKKLYCDNNIWYYMLHVLDQIPQTLTPAECVLEITEFLQATCFCVRRAEMHNVSN